ncbi:APGW-amide-related neuropeptide [Mytilus coruscus]|uniref:APGW-amide-related neuropeptide n=1 Tax=Mytilus coruscus TaxID=42192 RepID=A0A6J8ELZ5_MYTCO|nr:APGW-amide-related neuropeptide [Mytilus coruscus]
METLNIFLVIFSLLGTIIIASSSDESSERKKRDIDTIDDTNTGFLTADKRRPGWGKRSFDDDILNNLDKRRPGWGKRSDMLYDSEEIEKRRPGWGKRGSSLYDVEKRKPGWGKRNSALLDDLSLYNSIVKRRPGWGKRSDTFKVDIRRPGWGKRAPGWGKRSGPNMCMDLQDEILQLYKLLNEAEKLHTECEALNI